MSDSLNAVFGRGEVTFKRKKEVSGTPLTELTVVQNKGTDYEQQILVKAWGEDWAKKAEAFKQGARINFGGELSRNEWEDGDMKNAKLEVDIQDGDDNAMIEKAGDDENKDHNEVRLTGEISFVDAEVTKPTEDFQKLRIMVSVPKTTKTGKDIRLAYPVDLCGEHADGAYKVGNGIVLTGAVHNRFEDGEGKAPNRYFADVIVSDKLDAHGLEVR